MKIIKPLLWILLAVVIVVIVGYPACTYFNLKNSNVKLKEFARQTYTTSDGSEYITFSATADRAYITTPTTDYTCSVKYEENIFTLTNEEITYELIYFEFNNAPVLYGGDSTSKTGEYYYFCGD